MNMQKYNKAVDEIKASKMLRKKTINKINEQQSTKTPYKILNAVALVAIVCVLLVTTDQVKFNDLMTNQSESQIKTQEDQNKLPTVDSIENLLALLKDNGSKETSNGAYLLESAESTLKSDTIAQADTTSSVSRYSTTNVQVQGVDEEDIIKTDGEYIYYLIYDKILIVRASDLKIIKEIKNDNYYITGMYLSGNKLVVLEAQYYNTCISISYAAETKTKAVVYDVTDKQNIKIEREVELEGNYITSRMVDNKIYLVTTKYLYKNNIQKEDGTISEEAATVAYNDSAVSVGAKCMAYHDILYIPESEENCYLNIGCFSLDNKREMKVNTILGAGNTIYMNNESLYVSNTIYKQNENKTKIYKFKLENLEANLVASTEFAGTILNQFSMDEHNGNFRVAVTKHDFSNNDNTENELLVFNENLQQIGKIEKIAKGERIYAVRFMGEKAYVVTFKQVDPLFVIDLTNPENPKILGELKIPGYSTYIHPYDANHIIGIGYDVTTDGQTKGIKMALFDVSDYSNPKEVANVIIGDKYSYSEVINNHKALLFLQEQSIIAFPVKINTGNEKEQGAIIYKIDAQKGFEKQGFITHQGSNYDYEKEVKRIIYIDNNLYTFSNKLIKKNKLENMANVTTREIMQ